MYGPNAPPPSGGFLPSVYNKSIDNVANDIPSVYYTPSQHKCAGKDFVVGDLVFVPVARALNALAVGERVDYDVRSRQSTGKSHVPLMTIMDANAELRRLARDGKTWIDDVETVSRWMTPLGAVLGVDVTTARHGPRVRGVNVCVSRRALVSNTFMPPRNGVAASSMDTLGVVYGLTEVKIGLNETRNVVQLWTAQIPEGEDFDNHYTVVQFDASHGDPDMSSLRTETRKPANGPAPSAPLYAIVYLGRVLHSPPRCPTTLECAKLCLGRVQSVRPSNVEVILGNM